MTAPKKRSVIIAGHSTSLSLEPEFWDTLKEFASQDKISVTKLLTQIDAERGTRNLSSATRVYILNRVRS